MITFTTICGVNQQKKLQVPSVTLIKLYETFLVPCVSYFTVKAPKLSQFQPFTFVLKHTYMNI